jgi:hypothetical protein
VIEEKAMARGREMGLAFSCCAHVRGKMVAHVGWRLVGGNGGMVGGTIWMALSECARRRQCFELAVTVATGRTQLFKSSQNFVIQIKCLPEVHKYSTFL